MSGYDPQSTPGQSPVKRSSPVTIALAWAVVTLPAAWGVSQTMRTATKLFQHPAPTTQPVARQPAH